MQPDLILMARKINDEMTQYIIQSMLKMLIQQNVNTVGLKLGILGISYKENTNDLRNSLALKLIKELHEYGFNCSVHDPMHYADTDAITLEPFDALRDSSVVIIVVGHDYYRDLGLNKIMSLCKKPSIVIDIPNLFVKESKEIKGLIYWNL